MRRLRSALRATVFAVPLTMVWACSSPGRGGAIDGGAGAGGVGAGGSGGERDSGAGDAGGSGAGGGGGGGGGADAAGGSGPGGIGGASPGTVACPAPRATGGPCTHFTSTHLASVAGTPQTLQLVAAVDLDGDGATDVLGTYDGPLGSISITVRGRCGAGLADELVPTNLPSDVYDGSSPALGDFDGDGKVDLVVATLNDTVELFPGLGDGTFGAPISTAVTKPFAVAAADFDGDGRLDLAVAFANGLPSELAVFLGRGPRGQFEMQTAVEIGSNSPGALYAGDLDGDGIPDVIAGVYTGAPTVFRGDRQGHLTQVTTLDSTEHGYTLFSGDFDHDGRPDVLVCSITGERCIQQLGHGDGTFTETLSIPLVLASGDLDGDGFPDVVDLDGIDISQSGGGLTNVQSFTRDYLGLQVSFVTGDFAGDGRLQALGSNGDVWRMTCP